MRLYANINLAFLTLDISSWSSFLWSEISFSLDSVFKLLSFSIKKFSLILLS